MDTPVIRPALLLAVLMAAALPQPSQAQVQRSGHLLLCTGCHGMNGEGRAGSGYPRLAGQSAAYLQRQLEAFAGGMRRSPVMEPLARALTAEERRVIATHFAQRHAPNPSPVQMSPSVKQPGAAARGETLARFGDQGLRVQACQNCHGALGQGHPPYNPYLAGLSHDYLRNELSAWKSGARRSDPSGNMQAIARNLSDADIDAVAHYYAMLAPPAPQPMLRPPRVPGPAPSSGGKEDARRSGKGVGSSAPVEGGATQGPGGGGGNK